MGTPAKTTPVTVEKPKQVEYPVYLMEERGKLILPPTIISQITFLHSHCGKTEWSGMLLYDVVKGNPSKPKDFELEAKHIFLMDIGSAASTIYETDGDIVEIFDEIPEAMEMKLGHIHTHHNMGAYFSGTDKSELFDNVDKHNYYLSLVVSFDGSYAAKVVFLSDMHTSSKMNYIDDAGVTKHFKRSSIEKHMVEINMRIVFADIGGFFADRLQTIKDREAEAARIAEEARKTRNSFGGHHNSHFHEGNKQLPVHTSKPINSKIIPEKMTLWEIEKLTKNVLMFDTDLKTESNVYAILHEIKDSTEQELDLYYDYMISHSEAVMDAFFDAPLDNDEAVIVLDEIVMCIRKYEGLPVLSELIGNIESALETLKLGYDLTSDDDENPIDNANDLSKTLEKMEEELHD